MGHNNSVLRKRTLLASMAHEGTEQTSRRAEIPPREEAALRAAAHRGAAAAPLRGLLWRPHVDSSGDRTPSCTLLAKICP